MAEKDWAAILKDEDRIIANSDRRFRYHCYSLESPVEAVNNPRTGNIKIKHHNLSYLGV